jgi:hypothetical protein
VTAVCRNPSDVGDPVGDMMLTDGGGLPCDCHRLPQLALKTAADFYKIKVADMYPKKRRASIATRARSRFIWPRS